MIAAAELARLAAWCRDHGVRLISDEIYHGITYETAAQTARAFGREAIVVNSFSKYYSMTGWRLGWMLVPPDLARSVECLAQNFYISPPALSQLAALPAFGCRAELDAHVARYRANRDLLIAMLRRAGLDPLRAGRGRFLSLCRCLGLTRDSEAFCRRMLAETGVATTPGRDFDPIHGDGWVRLSFAGSTEDIAEAARPPHRMAAARRLTVRCDVGVRVWPTGHCNGPAISTSSNGWRDAAKGSATVTPLHVKPFWKSSDRSRRHPA